MKIPALYLEEEEDKRPITSRILTRDSLFVWFDSFHDSNLLSQIGMGLPRLNQAADTLARNRLNEIKAICCKQKATFYYFFLSLIPVKYIKKRFLYAYLFVCN